MNLGKLITSPKIHVTKNTSNILMGMCICLHMCKQSRGIKSLWSKVSKYSFNTCQFKTDKMDWDEGSAGMTPTSGESLGLCREAHTLAPFQESSRQQLTRIFKLTYFATPTKEKGRKRNTLESVCLPLLCSHPLLKALDDESHLCK